MLVIKQYILPDALKTKIDVQTIQENLLGSEELHPEQKYQIGKKKSQRIYPLLIKVLRIIILEMKSHQ